MLTVAGCVTAPLAPERPPATPAPVEPDAPPPVDEAPSPEEAPEPIEPAEVDAPSDADEPEVAPLPPLPDDPYDALLVVVDRVLDASDGAPEDAIPVARDLVAAITVTVAAPSGAVPPGLPSIELRLDGAPPLEYRVDIVPPPAEGVTARSVVAAAQSDGVLVVPAPEVTGVTQYRLSPLWLVDAAERLRTAGIDATLLASLADAVVAVVGVEAVSEAATVPTALVLADVDIAGNSVAGHGAATGARQVLEAEGFGVHTVDDPRVAQQLIDEPSSTIVARLYDTLPFDTLSRAERIIVGVARIVDVVEADGGDTTVTVELTARAVDVRRDEIYLEERFVERVTGTDASSVVGAAFRSAGRRLATRLIRRLP